MRSKHHGRVAQGQIFPVRQRLDPNFALKQVLDFLGKVLLERDGGIVVHEPSRPVSLAIRAGRGEKKKRRKEKKRFLTSEP